MAALLSRIVRDYFCYKFERRRDSLGASRFGFDDIIFDLKATAASRVAIRNQTRFIAENAKRCPLRISSGRIPQRVGDYGGAMDRTSGLSGKPASLCATHGRHGRTNSETRAIVHGRRYSRLVCETASTLR